jgi:hypothetical protein
MERDKTDTSQMTELDKLFINKRPVHDSRQDSRGFFMEASRVAIANQNSSRLLRHLYVLEQERNAQENIDELSNQEAVVD